jgi:hypothetical protein
MKPETLKGKIVKEFFLSIGDQELPAPNQQGKVGAEFEIVGIGIGYTAVNFKDDNVDYFIDEDDYENIEILG